MIYNHANISLYVIDAVIRSHNGIRNAFLMVFNKHDEEIYDQNQSGNIDQDQGEIKEKSGNFISHSEREP